MNCGHDGCQCQVAPAERVCSDHCREHAGKTDHGDHACECGHAACESSAANADRSTEDDIQAAFD